MKSWTVESRLKHAGHDFDPLVRTIIGLQAKVFQFRDYFFRNAELPKRQESSSVNIFYGEDVRFLDMAIAEALKDRQAFEYREQMMKHFDNWGKHPGK
jgi:hypothetical protein